MPDSESGTPSILKQVLPSPGKSLRQCKGTRLHQLCGEQPYFKALFAEQRLFEHSGAHLWRR